MSERKMTGEELAKFLKSVGAEPPDDIDLAATYDVEVSHLTGGTDLTPERLDEVMTAKTPNLVAFHAMGARLSEVVKAMALDLARVATMPTVEGREEDAHGLLHLAIQRVFAVTDAAMDAMPCQQDGEEKEEVKCLH
jgi:hypothetical protein